MENIDVTNVPAAVATAATNLEEKSLCPCVRCKYQVARKRRICNEHVKKWGVFPIEAMQPLLSGVNVSNDEVLDLQPQWLQRARGNVAEDNPSGEEPGGADEFFETDMDEMIDAFHITDHTEEDEAVPIHEGGCHMQERSNEPATKEEVELRRLARLPLYAGTRISVLRTCLSILNLQSIFGWSDTSVSKLFL